MYTTTIPKGKIDEAELIALVEQINILTKSKLNIEHQFVITTDDANLSSMLDSLMDALPKNPQLTATKKNGKTKLKKKSAGMTSHQVRIEETKEILSKQAFNKRLAAGEVSEFTTVTNAKGEQFVVVDGKLVKGPQS